MIQLLCTLVTNAVSNIAHSAFTDFTKEDFKSSMFQLFDALERDFVKKFPTHKIENSFLVRQENVDALCKWVKEKNILFDHLAPNLNLKNYDNTSASQEELNFVLSYVKSAVQQDHILWREVAATLDKENNWRLRTIEKSLQEINAKDTEDNYQSKSILRKIDKLSPYFVQTKSYRDAIGKLGTGNGIILKGCSGIGKTGTSCMIAAHFIKRGYDFQYVRRPQEKDFYKIKGLLDINEKQIVIMDDFLGDTQLSESESCFSQLIEFLEVLGDYSEAKVIFNSRKTILRNAKDRNPKLANLLKLYLETIDLEKWGSVEEKVDIFKIYSQKNDIIQSIKVLWQQKKWTEDHLRDIILHDNFTPLLMDLAAKECAKSKPEEYIKIFKKYLDHPDGIWEMEMNALEEAVKDYIYIIYSLSDCDIEKNVAETCYKKYRETTTGLPNLSFEKICDRAEVLAPYEDGKIDFAHPSVKDYLMTKIPMDVKEGIIQSSIYIEQVAKLDKNKETLKQLMSIPAGSVYPRLLDLKVLPEKVMFEDGSQIQIENTIFLEYLKYLSEFHIEEKKHQPVVTEILNHLLKYGISMFFLKLNLIFDVLKLEYDFLEVLSKKDNLETLFEYAHGENLINVIALILDPEKTGFDYTTTGSFYQSKIQEAIHDIREEELASWVEQEAAFYIENERLELDEADYDEDNLIDSVVEIMTDEWNSEGADKIIAEILKKYRICNWEVAFEKLEISYDCNYLRDVLEQAYKHYQKSNYLSN